jgi:hypothetical protein
VIGPLEQLATPVARALALHINSIKQYYEAWRENDRTFAERYGLIHCSVQHFTGASGVFYGDTLSTDIRFHLEVSCIVLFLRANVSADELNLIACPQSVAFGQIRFQLEEAFDLRHRYQRKLLWTGIGYVNYRQG